MQSWSVHPIAISYRKWFARARTATDMLFNMANGIDVDFVQLNTDMNKIWLLILVLLTVQFACYANETHENETHNNAILFFKWGPDKGIDAGTISLGLIFGRSYRDNELNSQNTSCDFRTFLKKQLK